VDLQIRDLLTVQQAAEYLGVSRFKLARLIADGELTTFTTPLDRRRKLVKQGDLDALKERVQPSKSGEGRAHKVAA